MSEGACRAPLAIIVAGCSRLLLMSFVLVWGLENEWTCRSLHLAWYNHHLRPSPSPFKLSDPSDRPSDLPGYHETEVKTPQERPGLERSASSKRRL